MRGGCVKPDDLAASCPAIGMHPSASARPSAHATQMSATATFWNKCGIATAEDG